MTTATTSKPALPQHRTVMLVLSRLEKISKCKTIKEEFAPPNKQHRIHRARINLPTFTIKISQQGVPQFSERYFLLPQFSEKKAIPDAHRCSVVKPPHFKRMPNKLVSNQEPVFFDLLKMPFWKVNHIYIYLPIKSWFTVRVLCYSRKETKSPPNNSKICSTFPFISSKFQLNESDYCASLLSAIA